MLPLEPTPDSASSQESLNPYAAPVAELGGVDLEFEADARDAEAERIRRTYLNHETAIKLVGSLHYFAGIYCGFLVIVAVIVAQLKGDVGALGSAEIYVIAGLVVVNLGLGYGLRCLQPWARGLEAAYVLFGTLATGLALVFASTSASAKLVLSFVLMFYVYVVYLLLSPKGAVVFSSGYRAIIEKTPHVKYKTSLIFKIAVTTFVGVVGLALVSGVIALLVRLVQGQ